MKIKISIIGAGSAVFSLNIIKDICLTPNLQDSIISFMDIDEERLDAAYTLCKRYAEELGIKLHIEKTTNRRESLKGADFVINAALAAGHDRLREGWSIARKYGYHFGGSLHIMHDEAFWVNFYQYGLMEEILCDMLDVCPKAWYLLIANPVMGGVTYLKRKYPEARIIGICHGYAGIFNIAEVMGLEKRHITYEMSGVNHFVWLTHFRYKGEDAFPLIDKWIKEDSAKFWESCPNSFDFGPKAVDLYKRFGVFPIGDTCTPGGGAWPWWYHTSDKVERSWKEDPEGWYGNHFEYFGKHVDRIKQVAQDSSIKVTEEFLPDQSEEVMIRIIESIACDIPRVLTVNILNDGNYVQGVPANFEVEIPGLVSAKGVQGIRTKKLPQPILSYLLRDRVAQVEMELEAYVRGDYKLLLSLVMSDPWSSTEKQCREFLDEILKLPYHKEMKKHYK